MPMDKKDRLIMLVDMNAFFASVEQLANPRLRGKAIAVTGAGKRTVVTTASYEARARGVRTGMNKVEAKRACPELIFVPADNRKYMHASMKVLDVLKRCSPIVEPYSIDEAFVDITGSPDLKDGARSLARAVKSDVMEATGLKCSVGIGPNKLIAKLAAGMEKPDGLVVLTGDKIGEALEDLPTNELWGIGGKLKVHLERMGIRTCGELGRFPISRLRRRFGIVGERLHMMGRGLDASPVVPIGEEADAKSVGHSTTLPHDIKDFVEIKRYILRLSEMASKRARKHGLLGGKVFFTVRLPDFYTTTKTRKLSKPTNDTRVVYNTALAIWKELSIKGPVRLLGVGLTGITKGTHQLALFEADKRRENLLEALDTINDRYGPFTVSWAPIVEEKEEPGVISPAWRPEGVKRVEVK